MHRMYLFLAVVLATGTPCFYTNICLLLEQRSSHAAQSHHMGATLQNAFNYQKQGHPKQCQKTARSSLLVTAGSQQHIQINPSAQPCQTWSDIEQKFRQHPLLLDSPTARAILKTQVVTKVRHKKRNGRIKNGGNKTTRISYTGDAGRYISTYRIDEERLKSFP